MSGRMHSASVENSPRLQRLLSFLALRGAEGATTREIMLEAEVMAVSAAADELRDNGIGVVCLAEGRTASGGNPHRYWLKTAAPESVREKYEAKQHAASCR